MDGPHAYDRVGALHFPLWPAAHEHVWRYLFDWVIAGEALLCAPGDLVLEFGSGPSFASELFNRIGYRSVALDLDAEVLGYARARWDVDQRLDARRAHFVAADGLRLPFADAVFDGIVCLNALHHMPDFEAALAEIHRVLRPGARAVFSEPGSRHADSPDAALARAQGALERSIVIDEIAALARRVGFTRMLLKPYVYPSLVALDQRDFRRYGLHLSRAPFTQPDQIARFVREQHPLFVLETAGERPRTSASPRGFGSLRAEVVIEALTAAVRPGDQVTLRATLRNAGPSVWLAAPREFGGQVVLGLKLCAADGTVLTDALPRAALPHDVAPGEAVTLTHAFRLPWFEAGAYLLRLDPVAESVGWFEQFGSPPVSVAFAIAARPRTSASPGRLCAALQVRGLPQHAAPGATLALEVEVRNVGDSVWLSEPLPGGGHVSLGVQLCTADGGVLSDALGRTALAADVAPGEAATLRCVVPLPSALAAGRYELRFDMVVEQVAWFVQYGSPVTRCALSVGHEPG